MKSVDVIVDSPLAARFTEVYEQLQEFWDDEAKQVLLWDDHPLVFENLTTIEDHDDHESTLNYLERTDLPAIVIAGSGMCTGGRVVNYLQRFIGNETADVLFVGYQAAGTPGRELQSGQKTVTLEGVKYPVRAGVYSISGYSAHADQKNLVDFVTGMGTPPDEVILVHGERGPKTALRNKLVERGINVRAF